MDERRKKHTPGPWHYVHGVAFKHYVHSECGDLRIGLQEMHPEDGRDVPAKANAHLIAAAPEMFDVLLKIREMSHPEHLAECQHPDNCPWQETHTVLGWIDAALAKATGRGGRNGD